MEVKVVGGEDRQGELQKHALHVEGATVPRSCWGGLPRCANSSSVKKWSSHHLKFVPYIIRTPPSTKHPPHHTSGFTEDSTPWYVSLTRQVFSPGRWHSRHTAQRSLLALSSNISPLSLLPCVFTLQLVRLRQISSHAGRSRWRRRDSGANSPLSTVERRGITLQLHLQVVSEEVRSSIMLGAFLALPSNSTLQSLGPGYSIISRVLPSTSVASATRAA